MVGRLRRLRTAAQPPYPYYHRPTFHECDIADIDGALGLVDARVPAAFRDTRINTAAASLAGARPTTPGPVGRQPQVNPHCCWRRPRPKKGEENGREERNKDT